MSRSHGSPAKSKEPTLRGPAPMVASVSKCRMPTCEESIDPSCACIQLQSMMSSDTENSSAGGFAHEELGNGGPAPGGPRKTQPSPPAPPSRDGPGLTRSPQVE